MVDDPSGTVVVLTALEIEYAAVVESLEDLEESRHPSGTLFTVGTLPGSTGQIAVGVSGPGNPAAALLAERAINHFRPRAVFFVGIAGALHEDLNLGTVVVATKVYSYHGGIDESSGHRAYPQSWEADHELDQIARSVSRGTWHLGTAAGEEPAQVCFRPIAAGEVVLNSRDTPLAEQLRTFYADAGAIEMESAGSAKAAHHHRMAYLTVRGISDKADGTKHDTDGKGRQKVAARNAAVFALAVASKVLQGDENDSPPASNAGRTSIQHVVAHGGAAFGVLNGSMHINQQAPPTAPLTWRVLDRPVETLWRTRSTVGRFTDGCALEVHVVPVDDIGRIGVAELKRLKDSLSAYGRSCGLFSSIEALTADITDQAVLVSSDQSGLLVSRAGHRVVWSPLPGDSMGPLLDQDDLEEQLVRSFRTLVGLPNLAALGTVALAAGLEPAFGLTEGKVRDMPRNMASGLRVCQHIRTTPEDTIDFSALTQHVEAAAGEVAARLHVAFHQAR